MCNEHVLIHNVYIQCKISVNSTLYNEYAATIEELIPEYYKCTFLIMFNT